MWLWQDILASQDAPLVTGPQALDSGNWEGEFGDDEREREGEREGEKQGYEWFCW